MLLATPGLLSLHNSLLISVADFVSKFSRVYENFAQELQGLVEIYKQKTSEYNKDVEGCAFEQSSLRAAWETLLQEIVMDVKVSFTRAFVLGVNLLPLLKVFLRTQISA